MKSILRVAAIFAVLMICLAVLAQEINSASRPQKEVIRMTPKALFKKLVGKWEGTVQTWFVPGKLADESKVAGEFTEVLNGRFLRHTYTGAMQGKPRHGEDTLAFNPVTKKFQSSWMDDFHMPAWLLLSEGDATPHGFSVRGDYDVAANKPKWGWRTEFELLDDDHLTITAYNIKPGIRKQKRFKRFTIE